MAFSWTDKNDASFGPVSPSVDKGTATIRVANGNTTGSEVLGINGLLRNVKVVAPATSASTFRIKWVDENDIVRNEYQSDLNDDGTRVAAVDDWPIRADHSLQIVTDTAVGANEDFEVYLLVHGG